jgi:RNA-directed DNA polymerase
MHFQQYKKQFIRKAKREGFNQLEINRCLQYAENLMNNGLPVIYDIDHFSRLVGYDKLYIRKAITHSPAFYRKFKVTKRNGTSRLLAEPLPSLKEIQFWILKNILHQLPIHSHAKAYKPGIGLKENLRFHVNQPMVMTMDIVDFFPSIKRNQIEEEFVRMGYGKRISNLFAKLCTLSDHLPQGAPTSPYLSNLIFRTVDEELAEFSKTHNIRYTRYADDLTFSGEFDPNLLFNRVQPAVNSIGLNVHPTKTKVMKRHQQQRVTGMNVNKKTQVPFDKRNRLRQEMYMIEKYGFQEHLRHCSITDHHYLNRLKGRVNFVLHLNPDDQEFKQYKAELLYLDKAGGVLDVAKSKLVTT